ncbi:MAG TPA: hypothetical protein VIO61_02365, partial [Anaerolineaceae bacterium]
APCPTAAPAPTAVPAKPSMLAPIEKLWSGSGHADAKSEAFVHWDTANPKEVPLACANCHSSTGAQEFFATGKVAKNVPTGTTVDCLACHSEASQKVTSVKFPSGVEIKGLGPEARCMTCHEGRAAKKSVDDQIAKFKATDPDKPVEPIKNADGTTSTFSFINAHYFTAALSLYGTEVKGGYEYAGKEYDAKFEHVAGFDTCNTCHNPHSLEVEVASCAKCHTDVKTKEDLKKIRMVSSTKDFNGNGDVKEGIAAEVAGIQPVLMKAIVAYAKEVAGLGIVYDGATYPYFLQDKDGDGKFDKDDKGAAIAYSKWTPRLLQAAFNYQVVSKDPGIFAHNPKYGIQLMYDSIADLNTKLATKIDMSKMVRDDVGHFSGSGLAFRDWDDTGVVPLGCAKCHSSTGLPQFMANAGKLIVTSTGTLEITGITPQPPSNGFLCTTCHTSKMPEVYSVVNVPFPNGKSLTFSTKKDDKGNLLPVAANLCIECHQGRQSTQTVNAALANFKEPDKVDATISFRNVHYFAAGATLFGNTANGIYEYTGKTYAGRFMHVEGFQTCTDCHDKHTLDVKVQACAGCHPVAKTAADLKKIRMTKDDYSGSKSADEPMAVTIETFQKRLYAGILKYAKEKAQLGIVYDPNANPYFFVDKDGDGKVDKDDKGAAIRYNAFTPKLLKAAYNYQYSMKDPGAFAHNPKYVLQGLYDSIEDIGGDLTGLTRPK